MTNKNKNAIDLGEHPLSTASCILGCFLYMALSEPLLNALGLQYTAVEGTSTLKVHPGAIFVFLSFIGLFLTRRSPLKTVQLFFLAFPAYVTLFAVTLSALIFAYLRSGGRGLGFLADTHLVVPMIALVLSFAPAPLARKAALVFVGFAMLDGAVGLLEYLTRHRLYTFDPSWSVLHEERFRASSLMGSPLASSLFLPVALFSGLSLNLSRLARTFLAVLLLLALVAFGSYFELGITLIALAVLGVIKFSKDYRSDRLKAGQIAVMAGLYVVFVVVLGAQIVSNANETAIALAEFHYILVSQQSAFEIFRHMSLKEIITGVGPTQIVDLASLVHIRIPQSDIDSPWVLLSLVMGAVFFVAWGLATVNFMRAFLKGQSMALVFAVLIYFILASTSNSFGRKDVIYPALIGLVAVVSAGQRANATERLSKAT